MKSRFILILLFCLSFVHATGQELNFDIKGKDYVYALFEIERPSNWPVIFAVAIDSKDTLHINTNSIDDCVHSVHKNSRSTVLGEIECHDHSRLVGRESHYGFQEPDGGHQDSAHNPRSGNGCNALHQDKMGINGEWYRHPGQIGDGNR